MVWGQAAMLAATTDRRSLARFIARSRTLKGAPATRSVDVLERLAHAAAALRTLIDGADADAGAQGIQIRRAHEDARIAPRMVARLLLLIAAAQEAVYVRFVRSLDSGEQDQYWQEWRQIGERLGLPHELLPGTYADYRHGVAEHLHRPRIDATHRDVVLDTLLRFSQLDVPLRYRLVIPIVRIAVIEVLPRTVRDAFGLRAQPWDVLVLAAFTRLSRLVHRIAPRSAARVVDSRVSYFTRLGGERRRRGRRDR
jgi:hypothetical protein